MALRLTIRWPRVKPRSDANPQLRTPGPRAQTQWRVPAWPWRMGNRRFSISFGSRVRLYVATPRATPHHDSRHGSRPTPRNRKRNEAPLNHHATPPFISDLYSLASTRCPACTARGFKDTLQPTRGMGHGACEFQFSAINRMRCRWTPPLKDSLVIPQRTRAAQSLSPYSVRQVTSKGSTGSRGRSARERRSAFPGIFPCRIAGPP